MADGRTVRLEPKEVRPGATVAFHWQADGDCALRDVRLVNREGPLDVSYVIVGHLIQAAFSCRPRLAKHGELVVVHVENLGQIGGQCAVEIDLAPVPWATPAWYVDPAR